MGRKKSKRTYNPGTRNLVTDKELRTLKEELEPQP
jgi:hypothetical protein